MCLARGGRVFEVRQKCDAVRAMMVILLLCFSRAQKAQLRRSNDVSGGGGVLAPYSTLWLCSVSPQPPAWSLGLDSVTTLNKTLTTVLNRKERMSLLVLRTQLARILPNPKT
jgi:hypothetical protein